MRKYLFNPRNYSIHKKIPAGHKIFFWKMDPLLFLAYVKKIILILSILMISAKMEAQQMTNTVVGEYYLRGVMETASGFKLNPDSTFEFFFSYGALDRLGKGTWQKKDDEIVFSSAKTGQKDFSLINSNTVANDKVTIKIMDENPSLRSHVYAIIKSGDKQLEGMTNSQGEIIFSKMTVDSIKLILEFCPEKIFIFSNSNKQHNNFDFRIEQDIMEVFFDHLALRLNEEGLEGQHPLLKEGKYRFRKN